MIKVSLVCSNDKCASFTEELFVKLDSEKTLEMCHFFCPYCGLRFEQVSWVPDDEEEES